MAFGNFPTLLTPEQAAAALQVSPGTLAVWRCQKRYGLTYIRIGRKVRYRESDILAFIESRRVLVSPSEIERAGTEVFARSSK